KVSVTYGQRTRGFDLSYVEPFLFGYRMAGGVGIFARQNLASGYVSYDNPTISTKLRLGFALTEENAFQPRFTFYSQKITLPFNLNNCQFSSNALINGGPGVTPTNEGVFNAAQNTDTIINPGTQGGCFFDGEASLAVRKELSAGPVNVSMLGF